MKYTKLSLTELKEISRRWAVDIFKSYQPDMVVYVAKAGFIIGNEIARTLHVELIGVETVREKGNRLKAVIAPLVRVLPDWIRNVLIFFELKSGIHKRNNKRIIRFIDKKKIIWSKTIRKILVVDDSVDTGTSILAVINALKKEYENAEIRVAGLNVWDKSEELVKVDYCLYRNTIIKSPMSKDSEEYGNFIQEYYQFIASREK